MIVPEIKIEKKDGNLICKIAYGDFYAEGGYKSDGEPFSLNEKSLIEVATDFNRIGNGMWGAVCEEFGMNPGSALKKNLIDKKYCNQMQIANIISYDFSNMHYYSDRKGRNVEEIFKLFLK